MKRNSILIGRSGLKLDVLGDCYLQTVELLTVQVRIMSFVIATQQTHSKIFLSINPGLVVSLDVVVSYPLFITSKHPFQKCITFVAIQQGFADENLVHEVFALTRVAQLHRTFS